jgi:hypothetical protein
MNYAVINVYCILYNTPFILKCLSFFSKNELNGDKYLGAEGVVYIAL